MILSIMVMSFMIMILYFMIMILSFVFVVMILPFMLIMVVFIFMSMKVSNMIFMFMILSMVMMTKVIIMKSMRFMMSQIMSMSMSSMAVTVTCTSLQSCHESESQDHSQCSHQSRHSILCKFVTGQNLKEGDVKQSSCSQTLEDTNQEDVLSRSFLHVDCDNDSNQDANGSVDTEEDDVDDDLHLLDPTGDHVSAHTEDDGNSVDGDGQHQLPDPRVGLLQSNSHSLKQAVDRQGHHHQETSQGRQNGVGFIIFGVIL